jgi:predicted dehydrogenase
VEQIGIGVIGLGMGSILLELNKNTESALMVKGVCSRRVENALRIKDEYKIKYAVDDYRELLNKEEIDIIAVYSPDHLHAEHCIAALEAGKHVVCTKPLVASLEDAKVIVRLVDEKRVKFLTGQTMRYEPQFSAIKRMHDDGDLGDILFAEAHYVHDMRPVFKATPWRLTAPKDYLYGAVCHPVDLLRWFLGDVDEVFAYGSKGNLTPEYPLPSNFLLNLKFTNGIMARAMGAFDLVHPPMPMMGISVFGSRGTAIGTFTDKEGGNVKVVLDKFEPKSEAVIAFPAETEGAYGHGKTVFRYLRHFEECLRDDTTPVPDAREGAKSVAVSAAAWESIETGAPAKVFNDF